MAIDLSAPLEEVWSYQQPHVPALPVVAEGMVFFGDSQRHTTAITEEGRQKLWQSAYKMTPEGWWGGFLIAYKHGQEEAGTYVSGPIQLIEPRTGRVCHAISVPGAGAGVSSSERWVIGRGYQEQPILWCLEPREGRLLWSKTLDKGIHVTGLAIGEDTVILGLGTGEVLALDAPTGERRWTSTVADLSWRRESGLVEPGTVRDRPSVFGDHVILNVVHHHVVSLSVQDGSRTWTWGGPSFAVKYGQRFEDRYYVIDWTGDCRVLDAATGREIAAINLSRQLPRDQGLRLVPPLLVNATHILIGSEQGNVTAFARDTGAFAWSCRTREGGSTEYGEIGFVVGNNRVYFGDSTFRIRCLGPKVETTARRARTSRRKSSSAHGDS